MSSTTQIVRRSPTTRIVRGPVTTITHGPKTTVVPARAVVNIAGDAGPIPDQTAPANTSGQTAAPVGKTAPEFRSFLALGDAAIEDIGPHLSLQTGAIDPRLNEQRQQVARRTRNVGRASIATKLAIDVIFGDSIGRGVMVTGQGEESGTLGVDDWGSVLSADENTAAGLVLPGPGLVLCNLDETAFYGDLKWSSLTVGAAGTTGPTATAGGGPVTSWVTSASNDVIGDSTWLFRRVWVLYEKQPSGGAPFQVSTDEGATYNGVDISTTGTGYGIWESPDLGAVTGKLRVKQTGAGTCRFIGHVPFRTDARSGQVTFNISKGGTASGDWLANRGWETLLAALVANGTPARSVEIVLGGNDRFADIVEADIGTNLTTLQGRAVAASPLSEVVIPAEYFPSKTGVKAMTGGVARFESTMVPVWEQVASQTGSTFVDLFAELGDCSDTGDPLDLSTDGGLHLGKKGQRAIARAHGEVFGHNPSGPAPFPQAGALVAHPLGSILSFPSGARLFLSEATSFGTFGYLGLGASTDTFGQITMTTSGILAFAAAGASSADAFILRAAAGVLSLGSGTLRTSTDPVNASDLARKAWAEARANHTGTQLASTISNFDTQVRTSRLDQMATPTATVSFGNQTVTNLANLTIQDGTASDGKVVIGSTSGNTAALGYAVTTDVVPQWMMGTLTALGLSSPGVYFGPGASGAFDVSMTRVSAGLMTLGSTLLRCTTNPAGNDDLTRRAFVLGLKVHDFTAPTAALAMNSQKVTALAAGTASTDAVSVSQLTGVSIATGSYSCIDHATRTTLALTQNRAYAARIDLAKAVTFTSVGVEVVTTAAGVGGVCYVSLFADSGGFPSGAPVATSASIDVTATGYREVTGQSMAITTPGIYHIVVHYNGSATVPTLRSTATPKLLQVTTGATPSGSAPSAGIRSTSDNWTSTAPSWAGSTVVSTMPLAWLKP